MDQDVLQPHELAGRGLWTPPRPTANPIVGEGTDIMAVSNRVGPGVYVAEEDITETLPDGRIIQIAVKGAEYPMTEAVKLGLVKEGKASGPSEKKPANKPTEAKAEKEAEEEDADADNVDAADTNPPPTPPAATAKAQAKK